MLLKYASLAWILDDINPPQPSNTLQRSVLSLSPFPRWGSSERWNNSRKNMWCRSLSLKSQAHRHKACPWDPELLCSDPFPPLWPLCCRGKANPYLIPVSCPYSPLASAPATHLSRPVSLLFSNNIKDDKSKLKTCTFFSLRDRRLFPFS